MDNSQLTEKMTNRRNRNLAFQIGFDRCGTTSLDSLFNANGYESVHFLGKYGFVYGRLIQGIRSDEDPVSKFPDSVKFFSDMKLPDLDRTVDGQQRPNYICLSRDFAIFERWYPNAKFILNVRPVDNWIRSTLDCRHEEVKEEANKMGEKFNVPGEAWLISRKQFYEDHISKVESYFRAAGSNRMIKFDIENDPIDRLIEFMRPEFDLHPSKWKQLNKSKSNVN